ncbi:hypothetical protein FRC20_000062 [Serendipita sp. 405]|nr:hypothetical protein FRC16_000075 [Serendipita sp. 398]KAG8879490.1 hypothetical protein FRC20_000062 [Serendipita sp. 405]
MSTSTTSKSPSSSKRRRSETSMQLGHTSNDHSAKHTPFKGEKPEPALRDHHPSKSAPKASKKARISSRIARDPQPATSTFSDGGKPSYPLARVFHVAKMDNESLRISREAVFVMALAAEEMTRRITRATSDHSENATEQDITVPRMATAISRSSPLSFLSTIIPETVSLSVAKQSRISNEVAIHPEPTSLLGPTKIVGSNTVNPPVAPSSHGGVSSIKTYSQREARAIANSKRSHRGMPATTSLPIGTSVPLHTVALPVGFDYRNLPIPPPGMVFQLPPGLNPDVYKNGIQWVPANPSNPNGGPAGQASESVNANLVTAHAGSGQASAYSATAMTPVQAKLESTSKQPPDASPTSSVKRSASTRKATARLDSHEHSTSKPKDNQSMVSGAAAETSTFHPGRLQGRTIYSTGLNNSASDSPTEIEKAPSGNDEEATNSRPSKKPRRTRGRTSGARRAGGDDTE